MYNAGKNAGRQRPIYSKYKQISPEQMAIYSYLVSTIPVHRGAHNELVITGSTHLNE
jgi:hypothetical protein